MINRTLQRPWTPSAWGGTGSSVKISENWSHPFPSIALGRQTTRTTMEEDINVDDTILNLVQEFRYLGSIITRDWPIEAEPRECQRSVCLSGAFEILWNNHNVSIRVKGKIYRALILSSLLYGAETDRVQETCEEATRFHDETSTVVNHEDQLAGQSDYLPWKTSSSERISVGEDTSATKTQ